MGKLGSGKPRPNTFLLKEREKKSVRKVSMEEEARLSKSMGFRLMPNSGATPMESAKSDGRDDYFVWELKGTVKGKMVLDESVIATVCRHARLALKDPGIVMTIKGMSDPELPRDWVCVPHDVWVALARGKSS